MNEQADLEAVEGRIAGRVQGVSYRAAMQAEAERLNVHGWVRNLANGEVGFRAQGAPGDVRAFLEWAEQGPPLASVTEVLSEAVAVEPGLEGFEVAR